MGASDHPGLRFSKFGTHDAPASVQRERKEKKRAVKSTEDKIMAAVRRADGKCRVPRCDCGRLGLRLECAHMRHRGMGGNPKLDRTTPDTLITFCFEKHRQKDGGDLKVKPDDKKLGTRGRCEILARDGKEWISLGFSEPAHAYVAPKEAR